MKPDQLTFTRKDIFRYRYAVLFGVQYAVIQAVAFGIVTSERMGSWDLFFTSFSPISLMPVQVTISLLSITILQLLLFNAEETVLGLTFQNIFFKWDVLKYFNLINCLMYMMLLMTANLLLSIVSVGRVGEVAGIFCRIGGITALLETLPLAFYMVRLGLLARYKKSRIYLLILKRIKKELSDPSKGCPICGSIIAAKDYGPPYVIGDRRTSVHNRYYLEEFFLFAYLFLNAERIEGINIGQDERKDIFYYKIIILLQREYAYNIRVLRELHAWGKKKFGEDIEQVFFHRPQHTCREVLGYELRMKR